MPFASRKTGMFTLPPRAIELLTTKKYSESIGAAATRPVLTYSASNKLLLGYTLSSDDDMYVASLDVASDYSMTLPGSYQKVVTQASAPDQSNIQNCWVTPNRDCFTSFHSDTNLGSMEWSARKGDTILTGTQTNPNPFQGGEILTRAGRRFYPILLVSSTSDIPQSYLGELPAPLANDILAGKSLTQNNAEAFSVYNGTPYVISGVQVSTVELSDGRFMTATTSRNGTSGTYDGYQIYIWDMDDDQVTTAGRSEENNAGEEDYNPATFGVVLDVGLFEIDSTHFLLLWSQAESGTVKLWGKVLTLSGSSVSFGTKYELVDTDSYAQGYSYAAYGQWTGRDFAAFITDTGTPRNTVLHIEAFASGLVEYSDHQVISDANSAGSSNVPVNHQNIVRYSNEVLMYPYMTSTNSLEVLPVRLTNVPGSTTLIDYESPCSIELGEYQLEDNLFNNGYTMTLDSTSMESTSNRALFVAICARDSGAAADCVPTALTFNAVSMTKIADRTFLDPGTGDYHGNSVWYLANPGMDAAYALTPTWSTNPDGNSSMICCTMANASQSTPTNYEEQTVDAGVTASPVSQAITVANDGSLVLGFFSSNDGNDVWSVSEYMTSVNLDSTGSDAAKPNGLLTFGVPEATGSYTIGSAWAATHSSANDFLSITVEIPPA